jgi:hypothetical protein
MVSLDDQRRLVHLSDQFLFEGGFPETLGTAEGVRTPVHSNIFNDIVVKDVVARFGARRETVSKLAYYLLQNIGRDFSYRRISSALDAHVDTISSYVDHLQEAELLFLVEMASRKYMVRLRNNKKAFLADTGLVHSMAEDPQMAGRLMENAVFLELKRRGEEVFYWKGECKREVDFVTKRSGQSKVHQLLQVCYDARQERTRERELASLIACMDDLGMDEGTIITMDEERTEPSKGKNIEWIPLWKFLLQDSSPAGER